MTHPESEPIAPPGASAEEMSSSPEAAGAGVVATASAVESSHAANGVAESEGNGAPVASSETSSAPEPAHVRKGFHLNLFARTDVGQVREHNEDNFLVADLSRRSRGLTESSRSTTLGPLGHLFAVCDGMGGAAAGEVASQLAVDIIYERMMDGLDQKESVSRDEIARRLVRAVETAGLRIFQEAKADRSRRGMGTTVTASALVDDHLFFAQVGDSRGYILREGVLTQVTRDQSLVNQLIEAGQLTAEEAETFEHNNIILQALGTADTVAVDLTYVQVRQGDTMLLCSDGLSGMVRFDEIREIMSSAGDPAEVCKSLIERANFAGGHDNVTVIIVTFDGDGLVAASSTSDDPLRYRKYPLPEEDLDTTTRGQRPPSERPRGVSDPSAAVAGATNSPSTPAARRDGWHEEGPHVASSKGAHGGDDRIDIPGTHVPTGLVVMIVVGVVALLAATAFFLLR